MAIKRFCGGESHDVVVFCNDHFGCCVENGLREGENGSHGMNGWRHWGPKARE